MTFFVFIHVVAELLSAVTPTLMVYNIQEIALHLYYLVIHEAPSQ